MVFGHKRRISSLLAPLCGGVLSTLALYVTRFGELTRVGWIINALVRGYLSQSSKLYGVLEASEHSLYAFLSRFDAI